MPENPSRDVGVTPGRVSDQPLTGTLVQTPLRDVGVTACGFCGRALPAGARVWCSAAHRQAAYRRRHQPAPVQAVLPAARSSKAGTVYECDGCGERFIGTQRCGTCNLFARRVGAGGSCPHCDEPVAIAELMEVSP